MTANEIVLSTKHSDCEIDRITAIQPNITTLLNEFAGGNKRVIDTLMSMLYQELRRMARRELRNEKQNATLRTTALIHEAYLKLIDQNQTSWQNRAHFLAVASQAMRRIIIDYARAQSAKKRGGGLVAVTFDEEIHSEPMMSAELVELDVALEELAKLNLRQAQVVEYAFFGGLTHDEIAAALNVSLPTVRRDWRLAKAWLSRRLRDTQSSN